MAKKKISPQRETFLYYHVWIIVSVLLFVVGFLFGTYFQDTKQALKNSEALTATSISSSQEIAILTQLNQLLRTKSIVTDDIIDGTKQGIDTDDILSEKRSAIVVEDIIDGTRLASPEQINTLIQSLSINRVSGIVVEDLIDGNRSGTQVIVIGDIIDGTEQAQTNRKIATQLSSGVLRAYRLMQNSKQIGYIVVDEIIDGTLVSKDNVYIVVDDIVDGT
jgi:hypothetical protein